MRSQRKSQANSRAALQVMVAMAGLVPVGAGLAGVVLGPEMAAVGAVGVDLDSHFRYLSGLLLGTGLVFWSLIPSISRQTAMFRTLTLIVVLGGLARALGVALQGPPGGPMLFGLAMELVVTPALCVWQATIAEPARQ